MLGNGEAGVALWTHALETTLGFDDFAAHRALRRVLGAKGRLDEALAQGGAASKSRPADVEARMDLANLLVRADVAETIGEYEEALRLKSDLGEVLTNVGVLLAGRGRMAEAVPHFETAVRLCPAFEAGYVKLALAFGGLGRRDDARRVLEELLRRNPSQATARRLLDELARR